MVEVDWEGGVGTEPFLVGGTTYLPDLVWVYEGWSAWGGGSLGTKL